MTHETSLLLPAAGTIPLVAAWTRWRLRRPGEGLRLHEKAPDFQALPASDGRWYSLQDLRSSSALVFVFMANRCPVSRAYEKRLQEMHRELSPGGVRIVGVDSISAELYATETLAQLMKAHDERGLEYPILRDADQRLARAFGASCTPQAFLFDRRLRLRYRGRIDDAFVPERATRHYLRDAIRAVLHDREPPIAETSPLGCTIDFVRPKPDPRTFWWRRAHELSLTPPTVRGHP